MPSVFVEIEGAKERTQQRARERQAQAQQAQPQQAAVAETRSQGFTTSQGRVP